ncbi:hypothetical protein BO94DRAFT_155714 [Aspergillus sclerotioniger CBS 115572]|uniref:Secreted protein n=1 Tax=Aspergillus sclerotioniger CBS 115572 TaxID=1450535 RepID=A0A317W828_9EURO|nr:hypothetical protein BO94DRAFT_155714 [Aspergillus sclerotioniger CBS 115572]PWY80300.1 hypothetical protein BO94DRAFT_155714 [Aspergillus sclerotioniger CBS 115572]
MKGLQRMWGCEAIHSPFVRLLASSLTATSALAFSWPRLAPVDHHDADYGKRRVYKSLRPLGRPISWSADSSRDGILTSSTYQRSPLQNWSVVSLLHWAVQPMVSLHHPVSTLSSSGSFRCPPSSLFFSFPIPLRGLSGWFPANASVQARCGRPSDQKLGLERKPRAKFHGQSFDRYLTIIQSPRMLEMPDRFLQVP